MSIPSPQLPYFRVPLAKTYLPTILKKTLERPTPSRGSGECGDRLVLARSDPSRVPGLRVPGLRAHPETAHAGVHREVLRGLGGGGRARADVLRRGSLLFEEGACFSGREPAFRDSSLLYGFRACHQFFSLLLGFRACLAGIGACLPGSHDF